jgi:hypothetical protein
MTQENMHTGTLEQRRKVSGRAKRSLLMAAKRRVKASSQQKSVSLPTAYWGMLEKICDLQTEALRLGKGRGSFGLSDLVEFGAEMYMKDLLHDLGPLPTNDTERRDYVRRLAEYNQRALIEALKADENTKPDSH